MEKGLTVIYNKEDETLAVDKWEGEEQRMQLWNSWCDVMLRLDRDGKSRLAVREFHGKDMPELERIIAGKNDKQIGMLMRLFKPEREMDSTRLRYAQRNEVDSYDPAEVNGCIRKNKERYGMFEEYSNRILEKLNTMKDDVKMDRCKAERLFELKGGFNFLADRIIESNEDVAWIFRQLSNKAIENSFALLQDKEGKNIILHSGMGNICTTMVDVMGIIAAAEKFEAQKIWFIHNHPSGQVYASRQDVATYEKMKGALGERMQDAVIIDTDRGIYGVFNEENKTIHDYEEMRLADGEQKEEKIQIPVYSFDKILYRKPVMDETDRSLTCSYQVAAWLSTHRFGERAKYGFLAINSDGKVMGNFILPTDDISDYDKLAEYITQCCISCNAPRCIVYGEPNNQYELPRSIPANLSKRIDKASAGTLQMLDFIEMENGQLVCSYNEEGKIYDCADGKNYFERIDIIPAGKDAILLRAKVDGEWMPAKELKGDYREKFDKGELDRYSLAEKFLLAEAVNMNLQQVPGIRR